MHIERKVKEQVTQLTQNMSSILASSIATENYVGTQISVTFTIVELDCDILQAMVNCALVALLNSTLQCRFLPAAICILQQSVDGQVNASSIDPSGQQLSN